MTVLVLDIFGAACNVLFVLQQRDTELKDTWELCMPKIEFYLNQIKPIPSLLHGDLWSGNAGAVGDEPSKRRENFEC